MKVRPKRKILKKQMTLENIEKREALIRERLPIDIVLREQWSRITLDMLDEMRIAHKRDMEANLGRGMVNFALREQETIRRIDEAIKKKKQGL
jgi:hypothetical protein